MKIQTQRLYVLDVSFDDEKDILEIQNTEYAKRYNLFPSLKIEDIHEEIKTSEMYKLVLKENGKTIGLIRAKDDYFRNNPKARSILLIMKEEYSSKGYISEAFVGAYEELFKKYDILTGYIFSDNKASIRVSEKLGWKVEGTLRKAVVDYSGQAHDLVAVSLTKEEYLKQKQ